MEYILVNKEQFRSRTGTRMWRLTWVCVDDLTRWETTVDEAMDNFLSRGWRGVCNNPEPWGVYRGLRRTAKTNKSGVPIITADSRQERIITIETQDLAIEVVIAASQNEDLIQSTSTTAN
jgi:hypothetical protein